MKEKLSSPLARAVWSQLDRQADATSEVLRNLGELGRAEEEFEAVRKERAGAQLSCRQLMSRLQASVSQWQSYIVHTYNVIHNRLYEWAIGYRPPSHTHTCEHKYCQSSSSEGHILSIFFNHLSMCSHLSSSPPFNKTSPRQTQSKEGQCAAWAVGTHSLLASVALV